MPADSVRRVHERNATLLALAVLCAGCQAIEEQRAEWRRNAVETDFVEAVGIGDSVTLRESLKEDRTLANAIRWVRGESSYRAESALTMAINTGRREFLEPLLAHGADPNLVDGTGMAPLGAALRMEKDRVAVVTLLLEKGADPVRRYGRTTALHDTSGSAAPEIAGVLPLLLARASRVDGRDGGGETSLHHAARGASVPAIRLLIARGADPNAASLPAEADTLYSDSITGSTPLGLVARDRQIAAAAALCALGADPAVRDSKGSSAHQVAAGVAAKQAGIGDPTRGDVVRHRNMAQFLAPGGGCDALLARRRRGETIPELEVDRIAHESECAAGWGWACGQAGWAFDSGEGAKQDEARALALFRTGCEKANSWSCGMVGIYHVEGTTVPKDAVAGARWLTRGCEPANPQHSDAQSCGRLGLLYAEGAGVPRDLGRARSLFRKACDAKYEAGCKNLAKYASAK